MSTYEARAGVAVADVASTPQLSPPGQWTLFWRRFKRDKFAVGSGVFLVLLLLLVFVGYPIIRYLLGHGPNDQFPFAFKGYGDPSLVGEDLWKIASDLSSAVTGEILYVDGGFNVMGLPVAD